MKGWHQKFFDTLTFITKKIIHFNFVREWKFEIVARYNAVSILVLREMFKNE